MRIFLLILICSLYSTAALAVEPRNIDKLKSVIRAYVQSGEYAAAMAAEAAKADA
jgi:hypothetical protein